MMRLLKSNNPVVLVYIFLFSILLWLSLIVHGHQDQSLYNSMAMPFMIGISGFFSGYSLWGVIIALGLAFLVSFQLVRINKDYIIISQRTYLPAFFYMFLASALIEVEPFNGVFLGSIFLLVAINYIFKVYRSESNLESLYIAGFVVAIAGLFYFPFIFYFVLIWISLGILRPFVGREWFVPLLGFLTPFLFIFTYYFVFSDNLSNVVDTISTFFVIDFSFDLLTNPQLIYFSVLGTMFLVASFIIAVDFQKKKIKARKYFQIFLWQFLISAVLVLVFKNIRYEIFIVIAAPLSFLFSEYYYTYKSKWISNILMLMFIASLIYMKLEFWF